mgnify:CR=1 FL=1
MPAYTYRSSGGVVSNNTGAPLDLSGSSPSGRASGDLLLLVTGQRTGETPGTITGFTQLAIENTSGPALAIYGRFADGTSSDLPSVDWDGTNACAAWLDCFYGDVYTDMATIVASTAGQVSAAAANPPAPAVSGVSVDNCLLYAVTRKNNTATDMTAFTVPSGSGWTKHKEFFWGQGGRINMASASIQQTTATDYGGTDWTIDGTAESLNGNGIIVYLKTASVIVLDPIRLVWRV